MRASLRVFASGTERANSNKKNVQIQMKCVGFDLYQYFISILYGIVFSLHLRNILFCDILIHEYDLQMMAVDGDERVQVIN